MMEPTIGKLAVLGGKPAFSEPLHVGRPNIGDRAHLQQRIEDILDRRWLTNNGPYVREFEQKICELIGVNHCVAMCNGTVALEIMTRAVGVTGQVVVPSFTFVATAHALQWQEISPLFCDVGRDSHNLDPNALEQLITPKTTGIIGVHLWGRACPVEALQEIADRRGLQLMFDASHAFHCSYRGRMIGGFGRAETLSFHATKFCNSFEGGAVVTNDGDLAEKMRLMRNFGFAGKDRVDHVGSNGKMSEVCAAMGLTSLESRESFLTTNRENYQRYRQHLSAIPGLTVMSYDEAETNNYHYVVVVVDAESAGLSRDQIVQVLERENVLARRYFTPGAHGMEPYRSHQPQARLVLPNTEWLAERVMVLPTGTGVSLEDVDRICAVIRLGVARSTDVIARLSGGD